MKCFISFLILVLLCKYSNAQESFNEDAEKVWNIRVFSIENFINKFNGELDINNNLPAHHNILDKKSRINNILYLINHDYNQLDQDSIKRFVLASLNQADRKIDFTDQKWFAEVSIIINYQGKKDILKAIFNFRTVDHESQFWSLTSLSHPKFSPFLLHDDQIIFPPNSHGNDFSSIVNQIPVKISGNSNSNKLLYLIKNGIIKLNHVQDITYHFFQIKNWYFTVNEFERKDQLSGWLISQIEYLPENSKVNNIEILLQSID